ncbi:MAG: helix-turn-helix transcriptional regulator [Blautia sp.]|nr:helix-turn-helix transcriptional regulator [Blautia sp.]
MTEGERIRYLRKGVLKKTLEEFGQVIGLGKGAMSAMETGQRGVTDQTIKSICREFGVSEAWLRTGEGDMFIQATVAEELSEFISRIHNDPDASFKRKLLTVLAGLSEDQWSLLADIAERLASPDAGAETEPEEEDSIDAKVEAYRRALKLEKEAKEKSEAS